MFENVLKQLPIHDYALWSVEQAGAMSFNLGHCMDARERNIVID